MRFPRPFPFKEALDANDIKSLLPSTLTSADVERIIAELGRQGAAIFERARFSAGVRSVQHLDVLDQGVRALTAGTTDLATARLHLKQFVKSTGYVAAPGEGGGLRDLASTARTNVQLLTNTQLAQGYGWDKQGQDPELLDAFPAQEFLRVEARRVPRRDWPQRWNAARAATTMDGATDSASGRMVALKGHPIWPALSRFGLPYEPFDYGSGKGLEDVSRAEAMDLGLIEIDTQVFPDDRGFNHDLQASAQVRSQRLREKLEATGLGSFSGDTFIFTGGDQ